MQKDNWQLAKLKAKQQKEKALKLEKEQKEKEKELKKRLKEKAKQQKEEQQQIKKTKKELKELEEEIEEKEVKEEQIKKNIEEEKGLIIKDRIYKLKKEEKELIEKRLKEQQKEEEEKRRKRLEQLKEEQTKDYWFTYKNDRPCNNHFKVLIGLEKEEEEIEEEQQQQIDFILKNQKSDIEFEESDFKNYIDNNWKISDKYFSHIAKEFIFYDIFLKDILINKNLLQKDIKQKIIHISKYFKNLNVASEQQPKNYEKEMINKLNDKYILEEINSSFIYSDIIEYIKEILKEIDLFKNSFFLKEELKQKDYKLYQKERKKATDKLNYIRKKLKIFDYLVNLKEIEDNNILYQNYISKYEEHKKQYKEQPKEENRIRDLLFKAWEELDFFEEVLLINIPKYKYNINIKI